MKPVRTTPTPEQPVKSSLPGLRPVNPARIQVALADFWTELAATARQIVAQDHLAAQARLTRLRNLVLVCMVGLNGVDLPDDLDGIGQLLGPSQRVAMQKTLAAPKVAESAWVGQAVALVVIYRWYAPQLVETFGLTYPDQIESQVLAEVGSLLATWPHAITSE